MNPPRPHEPTSAGKVLAWIAQQQGGWAEWWRSIKDRFPDWSAHKTTLPRWAEQQIPKAEGDNLKRALEAAGYDWETFVNYMAVGVGHEGTTEAAMHRVRIVQMLRTLSAGELSLVHAAIVERLQKLREESPPQASKELGHILSISLGHEPFDMGEGKPPASKETRIDTLTDAAREREYGKGKKDNGRSRADTG